jgi:hypothetical protein
MLKSFSQFINESENTREDFIKDLALKLSQKIRTTRSAESEDYETASGMEFKEPFEFDLALEFRRDSRFEPKVDSHFHGLPWENINYEKDGYAIDANTLVNNRGLSIPKIIITVVLNPNEEPHLYSKLYARIVDILTHELNHVEQVGLETDPFTENPSSKEEREAAKKNFKYFLMKDEMESMIEGMEARSKVLDIPLDYVFTDYLSTFVQSKYITPEEYSQVMQQWVKYALERYPDASFSKNVDKIVNSI